MYQNIWLFLQMRGWHRKSELLGKVHNYNASCVVGNVLLPNLCCPLPRDTAHLAFRNLGNQTQRNSLICILLIFNLMMLFILSPSPLSLLPTASSSNDSSAVWVTWPVPFLSPAMLESLWQGAESLYKGIIVSRAL